MLNKAVLFNGNIKSIISFILIILMMSNNISSLNNNDDSSFIKNERPTLLKVLCILSWIGSGIQIFTSTIYTLFINETIKQEILTILPDEEMIQIYEGIFELMDATSLWYLILYIGNIGVVYLMWNFNKIGFYGYVLIQILILFVPFFINPFQINQLVASSFFPMIFIFLYGINLKYLD